MSRQPLTSIPVQPPAAVGLTNPATVPLCKVSHGKALEEDEGKPEDRLEAGAIPILKVREKVLMESAESF